MTCVCKITFKLTGSVSCIKTDHINILHNTDQYGKIWWHKKAIIPQAQT